MGLQAKTVHIPAGLGINEGVRPEWLDPAQSALRNENIRNPTRMVAEKRYGFAARTSTQFGETTPTTGYRLFSDRQTTVRIVDDKIEIYSAGADRWRTLARVPEADFTTSQLPALGTASNIQDVEVCNGYLVALYNASSAGTGYTFAALVDSSTLGIVRAPEQLSTGSWCGQVVSYGTRFFAVFGDESGTTIKIYVLDTSSATTIESGWTSLTTATDWTTFGALQCCSLNDRVAIVYVNNLGGTSRATVRTYDSTGLLQTQTINTSSVTPTVVAIGGLSADTLWAAWNETTSVKLIGFQPTAITSTALATTATIMTLVTGARGAWLCPDSAVSGQGRLIVSDTATTARTHMRGFRTSAGAAATNGSQITSCGSVACGKPFQRNARYYQPFYAAGITGTNATSSIGNLSENGGQQTFYVCDITEDVSYVRPIASVSPGTAAQSTFMQGTCALVGANTYVVPCAIKVSTDVYAPTLVRLDFASSSRWGTAVVGNSTYLSGGIASCFDGQRAFEAGFTTRPTLPTTATSGTGITAATGWRYIAVYEAVDGDGNWHVSGCSDPSVSTGAVANKTVTVTTTPLGITSRGASTDQAASVRVAFYRTLDGGEPPYYRVGTTINAPGTATVTFADTVTDATLATQAKLYRQPGVTGTAQDKRPPPGFRVIAEYAGMLVGASGPDVWWSGQVVSGEGAWFNPIFAQTLPEDVTAFASQDGVLFAFTRRAVYALAGEPPSDNGTVGGLGVPQRLSADVGCIEPRSVCVTAVGVFFQSERGIELLDRSRTVGWIGESVSTTLGSFPYISAATFDADSACVLFECANQRTADAALGNGRTLVFNLTQQSWVSADRRTSEAGIADTSAQASAMVYSAGVYRFAWMASNGVVYVEDRTSWLDPGARWVTSLWEPAEVKLGLQQQQEVFAAMLLAERYEAAGLKIEIAYDGVAYDVANDKVWTEADSGLLQFEFMPRGRSQRIRMRVSDTAPAAPVTGRGFGWIGLSVDVAPNGGPTRGLPNLAVSGRK